MVTGEDAGPLNDMGLAHGDWPSEGVAQEGEDIADSLVESQVKQMEFFNNFHKKQQ